MKVQTGIEENRRREVADAMNRVLADTFTLYYKTHTFHWNVTGPTFHSLHGLFEEQYNELWTAIDLIAERVRGLGYSALVSMAEIGKQTSLKEAPSVPNSTDMLRNLLEDNESLARSVRHAIGVAVEASDESTVDILTGRLEAHEKASWMLRSSLS